MSQPVGRLAPSPTGAQHLGNARTYLLAWLSIRSRGGKVILRIEDIDSPRIKPWATTQAIDDLNWLGLDWDEGPHVQTERTAIYAAALDTIIRQNRAYRCVCSRTDVIEAASAPHAGSEGPIYPGTCAGGNAQDPEPLGRDWCWRFRVSEANLVITDRLVGKMKINPASELGDFPISRKTGMVAYQLAVVVDDAAMGVTEVVRGDDLLPSAFRQKDLGQVLDLPTIEYAHVPLVVGTDGRRLAKRHGDTRLSWFRDRGTTAEQIIGWGAWTAGLIDRPQPISAAELIPRFDWNRVSKSPVVLDHNETRRLFGFG